MPYALYRLYDGTDELLYVGISMNFPGRLTDHKMNKPWWTDVHHVSVQHYRDRASVLAAEREAIRVERPRWNVQHNERPTRPQGAHEQAFGDLFGILPDMEDPNSRAVLAGAFDAGRVGDLDESGEPIDYSGWPEDVRAAVQSVSNLSSVVYDLEAAVSTAVHHLCQGTGRDLVAEARQEFIRNGHGDAPSTEVQCYALIKAARALALAPVTDGA